MPAARGEAQRGEGARRAPAPPLLSGAEPPPAARSRGCGRTALHGSGGGNGNGDSLPLPSAVREGGRAGGCGGMEGAQRRWQGSFNLPGWVGEMRMLARGRLCLASSRFPPNPARGLKTALLA